MTPVHRGRNRGAKRPGKLTALVTRQHDARARFKPSLPQDLNHSAVSSLNMVFSRVVPVWPLVAFPPKFWQLSVLILNIIVDFTCSMSVLLF